jgi:hypothetical protein
MKKDLLDVGYLMPGVTNKNYMHINLVKQIQVIQM